MTNYNKNIEKNQQENKKNQNVDIVIKNKFTEKKKKNLEVKDLLSQKLSESGIKRYKDCGVFLSFMTDSNKEKHKLKSANFCKNRFCPTCKWVKAQKDALQISILMKYIEQEEKKKFIFVTLTSPNVSGENLKDEITKFNLAFKNLMKRKKYSNIVKGYIRKLEITYNKNTDTFHPHFHILIAVNKSYFTDTKAYIKQSEWLNDWQNVMKDETITQVDVRKFKGNTKGNEVLEIASYSAKDSDLYMNDKVFDTYYNCLSGRQLITYNGVFKDTLKLYKEYKKIKDMKIKEKHILHKYFEYDTTEYTHFLMYQWGLNQYEPVEFRELTKHEKEQCNNLINDIDDIE